MYLKGFRVELRGGLSIFEGVGIPPSIQTPKDIKARLLRCARKDKSGGVRDDKKRDMIISDNDKIEKVTRIFFYEHVRRAILKSCFFQHLEIFGFCIS